MSKLVKATNSVEQTKKLGILLGEELRTFSGSKNHAFCLALTGELGSGKTLFVQGLARGLGISSRIQSPTFVFMKRYGLKRSSFDNMWHIDLYRLEKDSELGAIGFSEVVTDRKNIVVVEWAERIRRHLPKDTLWIIFTHEKPESRLITFTHEKR